jgi:NADH-quinone oxidoreductase subunit K
MIGILHYLILSTILFFIGVLGIFARGKNIISLILSIEIMLLAVNINFIIFSNYWGNFTGQIFVLFILAVSACEMAIALIALLSYFNKANAIWVDDLQNLRG